MSYLTPDSLEWKCDVLFLWPGILMICSQFQSRKYRWQIFKYSNAIFCNAILFLINDQNPLYTTFKNRFLFHKVRLWRKTESAKGQKRHLTARTVIFVVIEPLTVLRLCYCRNRNWKSNERKRERWKMDKSSF